MAADTENSHQELERENRELRALLEKRERELERQQDLAANVAFQSALADIRGVGEEAPEEEIWNSFLNSLIRRFDLKMAWYGHYVEGEIRPVFAQGKRDQYLEGLTLRIEPAQSPDANCAMSRAVLDRVPFSYGDLENDLGFRRWRDYALELGYRSNLALPFVVQGEVEGGVMVYSGEREAFPENLIRQLEILLRDMSHIIANRRSRRLHRQWVEESEARFRLLVESMPAGVIFIEGDQLSLNRAMEAITGYPREEINTLDKWFATLYQDREQEEKRLYLKARAKGFPRTINVTTIHHRDGHPVKVRFEGQLFEDKELWVMLDVTRQSKMEEDLISAKERAEEADRAKSRFLANMSHELRTPLNGIIGFADLLAQRCDSSQCLEKRRFIQHIQASGKHLLSLIGDLLDIAKVDAHKMKVHWENVEIHPLLNGVHQMIHSQMDSAGLHFHTMVDANLKWLYADARMTRQIFLNLISNAIKFSPTGGTISVRAMEANDKTVRFEVEDEGEGIPPEEQESVFSEFYQVEKKLTGNTGGTGLGLALSKRLAQLQKGEIGFKQGEKGGACFWFTLLQGSEPALKSDNAAPEKVATPPRFAGKRVLVAEDNDVSLELVEALLQAMKVEVISAKNGKEAVELGGTASPDLILMDMRMPVMDGLEATRLLKKKLRNRVPVVALTASVDAEACADSRQAGCDDYLTKPMDTAKLIAVLERYLK